MPEVSPSGKGFGIYCLPELVYRSYPAYRRGQFLPYAGGTLDQPKEIMNAFEHMDRAVQFQRVKLNDPKKKFKPKI